MDEKINPFRTSKVSGRKIQTEDYLRYRNSFVNENNCSEGQNLQSVKQLRSNIQEIQSKITRNVSYSPMQNSMRKGSIDEKGNRRINFRKDIMSKNEEYSGSSREGQNNHIGSYKDISKIDIDKISRYQEIANLTEEQNLNLKEQNRYLLAKLRKMQEKQQKMKRIYNKAKYYKTRWVEVKQEVGILKEETYIYRDWLQELREIAVIDIPELSKKVQETKNQVKEYMYISGSRIKRQQCMLLKVYEEIKEEVEEESIRRSTILESTLSKTDSKQENNNNNNHNS